MMMLRFACLAIVLGVNCIGCAPAKAQASLASQPLSEEISGGTGKFATDAQLAQERRFTIFRPRNLDPTGRPCLSVSSLAESQPLSKTIFNHILVLDNHCGKEIRIKACYYKTTSCSTMSVGGYKKQQQILGIFSLSDFQYSYREYVN